MEKPLYQKIMDDLRANIFNNDYKVNEVIPSESELEIKYGVSNITVRRALNELEREGIINRVKGKGSFVSDRNFDDKSSSVTFGLNAIKLITLVLTDRDNSMANDIINGVSEKLSEFNDFALDVVCSRRTQSSNEKLILEKAFRTGPAGIIILPNPGNKSVDEICILASRGFPIVTIDQNFNLSNVDSVVSDNKMGTYNSVSYLIKKGHRNIAFVSDGRIGSMVSIKDRFLGYCKALTDNGIPIDSSICLSDYFSIAKADLPHAYEQILREESLGENSVEFFKVIIDKLLNRPDKATAIQFVNDMCCYDFMRAASTLGVNVPKDISVIGFDNLNFTAYLEKPLTTVNQDFFCMGYKAAELIIERINDKNRQEKSIMIPTLLIERSSVNTIGDSTKEDKPKYA